MESHSAPPAAWRSLKSERVRHRVSLGCAREQGGGDGQERPTRPGDQRTPEWPTGVLQLGFGARRAAPAIVGQLVEQHPRRDRGFCPGGQAPPCPCPPRPSASAAAHLCHLLLSSTTPGVQPAGGPHLPGLHAPPTPSPCRSPASCAAVTTLAPGAATPQDGSATSAPASCAGCG